jgi:outer membrane biogenesis lipoprotein LolB
MRTRAVIAACALLGLAGCTLWGPRRVALPAGDPRVAEALERAQHDGLQRHSLRAVGRLRLAGPGGRGGVREIVLVQRPDQLRLESQDPLGRALALLAFDGQRFVWFDGGRIETGLLEPQLLRDRLGLELEPSEAVAALLASPPSAAGSPRAAYRQGEQTLVYLDGWQLRLSAQGELAALEALDGSGGVRWRARYDAWRDVPGGRYPGLVRIEFPPKRTSAELELHDVELNATLEPTLFRGPPSSAQHNELP